MSSQKTRNQKIRFYRIARLIVISTIILTQSGLFSGTGPKSMLSEGKFPFSHHLLAGPSSAIAQATGPGGVGTNLAFWLKADGQITDPGTSITDWTDETGSHGSFTAKNSDPDLQENIFNFNPAVNFDGDDYLTYGTQMLIPSATEGEIFYVLRNNGAANSKDGYPGQFGGSGVQTAEYDYLDANIYDTFGTTVRKNWVPTTAPAGGPARNVRDLHIYNVHSAPNDWAASFDGIVNFASGANTVNFASAHSIHTFVGAAANSVFRGDIAEIVLYDRKLTAAERRRVNSSLALKYGITLGDPTVPLSYTNSADTVIWDASNNSSYHNDVAGIGRDDTAGLNQKQSRSVNSDALVTIGVNGIAATNSANANSFAGDQQFLIWGNDNGSTAFDVAFAGTNATARMSRVWRVAENSEVGTIEFCTSSAATYLLVNNSDSSFAPGTTTELALTPGSAGNCVSGLNLADGAYFTLGFIPTGPGDVKANLKLWLKANNGVNGSTPVTQWGDSSGNGRDAVSIVGPDLLSDGINFNPALDFVRANTERMQIAGGIFGASATLDNIHIYAVAKTDAANVANDLIQHAASPGQITVHLPWSDGIVYWDGGSGTGAYRLSTPWGGTVGTPYVWSFNYSTSATPLGNNQDILRNGDAIASDATATAPTANGGDMMIGSSILNTSPFGGDIAEIIVYTGTMTLADQNKIQSYLGLKYGVTLDTDTADAAANFDYVDSTGATVWPGTTDATYQSYHNGLAGIGRDDGSVLAQKQSQSSNADSIVTMGLGAIAATNADNANTFGADRSFLVWGHNNLSLSPSVVLTGTTLVRKERVWRVANVNGVGVVQMRVPQSTFSHIMATLVQSTDTVFDSNDTQIPLTNDGNGNYVATVTFTDGDYFTFAQLPPPGPGGIDTDLNLWLKAGQGNGSATDGDRVTLWDDQSDIGNNATGTGGAVEGATYYDHPDFNINFNPVLDFDGVNDAFALPNATFIDGNTATLGFYVFAPDGGTYSTLASAGGGGSNQGVTNIVDDAGNNILLQYVNNSYGANATEDVSNRGGLFAFQAGASQRRIYHNGILVGSSPSGAGILSSPNRIGTLWTGNNDADGRLAEVVHYKNTTPDADRDKIESYLALKYGITIGSDNDNNGTPFEAPNGDGRNEGDYVLANGTVIWDASASSAYHNNIAALVRDDTSGLYQRQSGSENVDGIVAIGLGSIAATNSANLSTIANQEYMIWGNDGASLSPRVPLTGTELYRKERIWRVDNPNALGTVQVRVPQSTFSNVLATLVRSTDTTFDSSDTLIPLADDGNGNYLASITFADGDYFTFAQLPPPVPGGVVPDLNFWFKGDAGTSTTTQGGAITQWDDQSDFGNDITSSGGNTPVYEELGANFNPTLRFDGSNDRIGRTSPSTDPIGNGDHEVFVVVDNVTTGTPFYMGSRTNNQNIAYFPMAPTAITIRSEATSPSSNKTWCTHNIPAPGNSVPSIATIHRADGGRVNQYTIEWRGDGGGTPSCTNNHNVVPNVTSERVELGRWQLDNGSWGGYLNGEIAEIAFYSRELTAIERARVHTYLAIKYGVSLSNDSDGNGTPFEEPNTLGINDGDYVLSDGTTIVWDASINSSYHNDIAGLGQDDRAGLNQRISGSTSDDGIVVIATDNEFDLPNTDGSRTSLGEGNFLVWGNNGLDATTWISTTAASGVPAGKDRLAREWMVQETGSVGEVSLQVNVDDPEMDLPEVLGVLYLLVDSDLDGDFGDETVQRMAAQGGGLYTISGINFVSGQRFTFATPNSGIRGFVFLDSDVDGQRDADEEGLENIIVTAVDANGVMSSTLTDADGKYVFLPESGIEGSTRITFSLPSAGGSTVMAAALMATGDDGSLDPTVFGQDNKTDVNFAYVGNGWTVVNNGFAPKERPVSCTTPTVATSCYSSGPGSADAGLFSFGYNSGPAAFRNDAGSQDMGSVWANTHSATNGLLYSAAALKRHVGLGSLANFNGVDTYTVDGVYVTPYSLSGSNFNPASPGFTLQGVNGIDLGTVRRTVDANGILDDDYELLAGNNVDLDAFAKVGTVGFGGADVAQDGSLWLVNLNQRTLIRVDTAGLPTNGSAASGGNVTTYPITNPGCSNGDYRPWALSFNSGTGYLGIVCSAETSQNTADLHAYIVSFDPAAPGAGFSTEIDFPLDYGREVIYYVHWGGPVGPTGNWRPWASTWNPSRGFLGADAYPQPILSDIQFTVDGDMILGFMDRFGHQTLQSNLEAKPLNENPKTRTGITAGEMAKVCTNGAGGWILEGSAGCAAIDNGGIRRTVGGGVNAVLEYFHLEEAGLCIDHLFFAETYGGGFCIGPNGRDVVSSVYGPGGEFTSVASGNPRFQGFRTFDSSTGAIKPWLTALLPSSLSCAAGTTHNMSQLACFCPPPPLEIGNRVWIDYDLDGQQDPGEPPIPGVTVELVSGSSVIATATTDARGEYYFSGFAGTSTASAKYGLAIPGSGVSVRIPNADGTQQTPLIGLVLTQDNQGSDDRLDSDATLSGDDAVISVTTSPGTIDHTFDFGFAPDDWDLALRKSVPVQYVAPGSNVVFIIDVFNQGAGPIDNIEIIDYVPANLSVNDANWTPNTLTGPGTVMRTLTAGNELPARGLWPGESVSVDINTDVATGLADNTVIINKAEIANMTSTSGSAIVDIDSTPDTTDGEANVKDDVINEDGLNTPGDDEDDHDPAQIIVTSQTDIYDLALRKRLGGGQSSVVNEGDDVLFTIEVFNQGTSSALNLTLVDRYPAGFNLSPNDTNWTDQGTSATYDWSGFLLPGQSTTVDIILRAGSTLGTVQNYAEIQSDDGDDVDSEPEGDEGDDNGDALLDDVISDDGTIDEDDHDMAEVTVQRFDLALRKQLAPGQPTTTVKGADVTYVIDVFNQGNVDAFDISVVDYLTDTLALSENDTNGWVLVETNQVVNTIPGPIAPTESARLTITLRISDTAALGQLDNYAEIVTASETPAGPPARDVDSAPDTINGNDPLIDDEIDDDGTTDQDDHDIASVTVGRFDLALIKEYISDTSRDGNSTDGIIGIGDQVLFRMTVTNQGDVPAYDIRVTDYNPEGIVADDSHPSYNIDNGWVTENMLLNHNVLPGPLNPGESTTIDIILRSVGPNSLLYPAGGIVGVQTNWAEISSASNLPGGPPVVDEDSTPDDDVTNDAGGQPGSAADDYVDGNGTGAIGDGVDTTDEDDHDPAQVTVQNTFDLAIIKYLVDEEGIPLFEAPEVVAGQVITYEYYVENQGTEAATSITLIEHVPAGLILTDSNWTPSNVAGPGTATRTYNSTLAPGEWFTDTVFFQASPTIVPGQIYTNIIEIASATNIAGLDDVDSDPDSNATNEVFIKDNHVRDNFRLNPAIFDEDDHDPAIVMTLLTLTPRVAVSKVYNGMGDVRTNETVSFTIRITNTGELTITHLPLEDRFNSAFLTFQSATPSESNASPNVITWDNLLAGDPDGLAISETISVDVYFTTRADTSSLPAMTPCTQSGHAPNLARVRNANADGTPVVPDADDDACDSVEILNPTAVTLAESSASQTSGGVLVRWSTVSESDIIGFNIWKSSGVEAELRSTEMIVATNTGQTNGSSYQWLDVDATLRQGDVYLVEIVKSDGTTERAVIDVTSERTLFIPLIVR
ncbi:MAG: SdrD B-like domain-containing protein [Chloroflexota bacterium]